MDGECQVQRFRANKELEDNPIRPHRKSLAVLRVKFPFTHRWFVSQKRLKSVHTLLFQMVKYKLSIAVIHQIVQCGSHLICVGTGWMRCLDSKALILCTQLAWEIAPSDIIMSHEVLRFYCFK